MSQEHAFFQQFISVRDMKRCQIIFHMNVLFQNLDTGVLTQIFQSCPYVLHVFQFTQH